MKIGRARRSCSTRAPNDGRRMILFWISSALVAAAALALALRPLMRRRAAGEGAPAGPERDRLNLAVHRDQLRELDADRAAGKLAPADYEQARLEIEKRLLEDVAAVVPGRKTPRPEAPGGRGGYRPAAIAGILLPVLAVGIYFAVGNPGALAPQGPHAGAGITQQQVEQMVERLAARLNENPEDVEGWKMLGRSLSVLGRFAEATKAYSKAAIRAPRDADLLADLADALAMARGQSMRGEPEELVLRALQVDPKNLKALALAGSAAYERREVRNAVRYWERMLPLVAADLDERPVIPSDIDHARAA